MSLNIFLHIKPVCQWPVTADENWVLVLVGKQNQNQPKVA